MTRHSAVRAVTTVIVVGVIGTVAEPLPARVVGADEKTDIALLKVEAGNLPMIPIGDSDALRVGEMVLAIGSPLTPDLAHSVTSGIVSAKGRSNVGLADYEDFIQTDAAINPGNSGGALINLDGELVGINTSIVADGPGHRAGLREGDLIAEINRTATGDLEAFNECVRNLKSGSTFLLRVVRANRSFYVGFRL